MVLIFGYVPIFPKTLFLINYLINLVCHRVLCAGTILAVKNTNQVADSRRTESRRLKGCRTVQGTGGGLMDAMSGGSATFFKF